MTFTGAGGARDAVADLLVSDLPAELDLLDAQYGDFTLDDVAEFARSEIDFLHMQSYPVLAILRQSWRGGDERTTNGSTVTVTSVAELSIQGFVQSSEGTLRLEQRTERLADAVTRVLLKNDALASMDSWHIVDEPRTEFGATLKTGTSYLQGFETLVSVVKPEDF